MESMYRSFVMLPYDFIPFLPIHFTAIGLQTAFLVSEIALAYAKKHVHCTTLESLN